jgi:hypothetical protein
VGKGMRQEQTTIGASSADKATTASGSPGIGNQATLEALGMAGMNGPALGEDLDEVSAWMAPDEEVVDCADTAEVMGEVADQEPPPGPQAAYVAPAPKAVENLPAAAKIFELDADAGPLIDAFDVMWERFEFGEGNSPDCEAFDGTSAAAELRTVLGGQSLSSSNFWDSRWQVLHWLDGAGASFDARVEFKVMDKTPYGTGPGAFSAGSSASLASTQTDTQTATMAAKVTDSEALTPKFTMGAEVSGGYSDALTQSSTFTSMGTGGLSMTLPAAATQATLIGRATLSFSGLIGMTRMGPTDVTLGKVIYGEVA